MRKHKSGLISGAALSAAVAAVLAPTRADSAITFNLVPAVGMSQQAIDGFTAASQRWSSLLGDNVTVNINIGFSALGSGILGSASSTNTTYTYTNTRAALLADRISGDDFTSYGSLQNAASVNILLNYTSNNPNGAGSSTPYLDNDGDTNNTTVRANHATAKALGLRSATNGTSDASITFSSDFSWDFNPFDGITGGTYDFVGIAAHEIGHSLGFVSGVDFLDTNSTSSFQADNQLTRITPLDLFRFSAQSIVAPGAVGVPDFTAGTAVKYFSIDGGTTNLAQFATGVVHGDGRQASHWKDGLGIGIMDPTAAAGEQLLISNFDRQAMDVIGWNINNSWTWIDPAGGGFGQGVRWSASLVPGAAQDATFNLNNTYSVSFSGAQSNNSATFRAGTVTLALTGNTYAVGTTINVAPLGGDTATLNIGGGTTTAASVAVGGDASAAGGTGLLRLDSSATLTVAGNLRVWSGGTLQYNGGNASAASIAQSGGVIRSSTSATIASPISSTGGTIQTDAGTLAIGSSLTTSASSTLNKTGAGTLTITGTQNHGSNTALNVSAGTLNLQSNAGSASVSNLAISSSATTNVQVSQNLRALSVTGGTTTLAASAGSRSIKTQSVGVTGAGRLDLTNHQLIVDYTGGTVIGTVSGSTYSGVTGLVQSGRNTGLWDGPGIVTSQSSATDGSGYTSLGVAEASDVLGISGMVTAPWGDQSVDATSVLVKYTYGGDANLSGNVDVDDYGQIDFNASAGGVLTGWFNGDFDYNGLQDVDDYGIIDFVVGIQGPPLLPGDGANLLVNPVPEPSGVGLVGAIVFLSHRRRRSP